MGGEFDSTLKCLGTMLLVVTLNIVEHEPSNPIRTDSNVFLLLNDNLNVYMHRRALLYRVEVSQREDNTDSKLRIYRI